MWRLCWLVVNPLYIYNLRCTVADIVHLPHPQHLVFCFELFGHAITFCHLFYEPKKHILSLFIYIGKVSVQFAFCEQGCIKTFTVRLDILQVPLSPNTDFDLIPRPILIPKFKIQYG